MGSTDYQIYTAHGGEIRLGSEADRPDEAVYPDKIVRTGYEPYGEGYISDGGIDSYITYNEGPGGIVNNGTAPLKIYVDGKLVRTVKPGTGVPDDDQSSQSTTSADKNTISKFI